MKILFFTDNLNAGGKERRLTELLKSLKNYPEIEFELVLMNKDIHYREIFDLNINIHFVLRKTKKDLMVFFDLLKHCRSYKPDIIHCWDSMTAVYCMPVCKFLKIKFVNGMVTNAPKKQNIFHKHWRRGKLTFPFSDRIVANSNAGLQAYSAPKKKSIVIYNGFDFKRLGNLLGKDQVRQQLNIGNRYVIGMVATYSENKDYKTFFLAALTLLKKRKDVIFLAIGNNTDSDSSKELVKGQYTEYFRLMGRRGDVESLINAMDICVLSTFTEGISNSIMEYMALARPVIATSGGGTGEIIVDDETGYLVNQSNPDILTEKMILLLDNPELRSKMGIAGKIRIMNEFFIEKMISQYVDMYKSLLIN